MFASTTIELLIFFGAIGFAYMVYRAISNDFKTSAVIKNLQGGLYFPEFEASSWSRHLEMIIALDRDKAKVGLIGASYTTYADIVDGPLISASQATDVCLKKEDVRGVAPCSWTNGRPTSVEFLLTKEIPKNNKSRRLVISGSPTNLSSLIAEISLALDLKEAPPPRPPLGK